MAALAAAPNFLSDADDPIFALDERLRDPIWRITNLYYIVDKQGQRVLFRPNWAQRRLLEEMHLRNIILKARQLGFTTLICVLFLDAALFSTNVRAGIIAHNKEDAGVIFRDKVQHAYDHLEDTQIGAAVREARPVVTERAGELVFNNNSSIRVATSFRSGTLQFLHVSEHAKICRKYPEKAEEIRTGALNAVAPGQYIFIESTAEGREGDFYTFCKTAENLAKKSLPLTEQDFKFFFYPWWKHPDYQMDASNVLIPSDLAEYFEDLRVKQGIDLTPGQRAWYTKTKEIQKDEMFREYPSTPEEAFIAAVRGAYYAEQMRKVRDERRIIPIPYEPRLPVNTAWDLGMSDSTSIIFHQRYGREHRLIDYLEKSGEGLEWYVRQLRERGYTYGHHFLPHDITVRELGTGVSRLETLESLMPGEKLVVVPKLELPDGWQAVRNFLPGCWFDEKLDAEGSLVPALEAYQREFDDRLGAFRTHPMKNWAIHAADAFRYLAIGAVELPLPTRGKEKWRRKNRSWRVA